MGSTHYLSLNFVGGAGFIGIAIALMGRQHPVGIFLSAVLFGALQAGGRQMQAQAGVSLDLIGIIQALIIIFIAAPMLVRVLIPAPLRRAAR
jgi:simple sugar transport system permease protein